MPKLSYLKWTYCRSVIDFKVFLFTRQLIAKGIIPESLKREIEKETKRERERERDRERQREREKETERERDRGRERERGGQRVNIK